MVSIGILMLVGVGIGAVLLTTVFIIIQKSWNIPVVVFKLVGDKRRPTLDLSRKAKIVVEAGTRKLKIRGTPQFWEMRNFKAENYYQTTMGRPALVLYEFAKDCYTPMRPSLWRRVLGKKSDGKQEVSIPVMVPVDMEFKEEELNELLLRAVDDFDPDFIVRNFSRIDSQYTGGWRAFLKEYGWIIGWLLLFCIVLVGLVLFFQKAPQLAAACAQAAVENSKNFIQKMATTMPAG